MIAQTGLAGIIGANVVVGAPLAAPFPAGTVRRAPTWADGTAMVSTLREVPVAHPESAYRPTHPGFILQEVFCLKYRRTVGSDNLVLFKCRRLQTQPGKDRASCARARVTVHESFDGSLALHYKGLRLATAQAPPDSGQLRSNRPTSDFIVKRFLHPHGYKPSPHHPRRRPYKASHDKG